MKRGTPRHPKMLEFADALNIPRYSAVGFLELLWHFTAEFTPCGDIGKYPDRRIEAALDWDGKPGALLQALIETGWVDIHPDPKIRLVVHDWDQHADQAVERKLKRADKSFLSVTGKVTRQSQPDAARHGSPAAASAPLPLPLSLPEPEPEPEPEPLNNSCPANDAGRDLRDEEFLLSEPVKNVKPVNGMTTQQSAWFLSWWAIYWRKVAVGAARMAFRKHITTEARFHEVMLATRAQSSEMLGRDVNKRPHGATWLNQERWSDEIQSDPPPAFKRTLTGGERAVLELQEEANAKRKSSR